MRHSGSASLTPDELLQESDLQEAIISGSKTPTKWVARLLRDADDDFPKPVEEEESVSPAIRNLSILAVGMSLGIMAAYALGRRFFVERDTLGNTSVLLPTLRASQR